MNADRSHVRLAELVAALSLGTDLGLGQPMEHVLRQTLIALELGERLGLDDRQRAVAYYVALLAWVGCHADSAEQAKWFGDDIRFRADTYDVDMVGLPGAAFMLRQVGAGRPSLERARLGAAFLARGRAAMAEMSVTHCLVTGQLADRLGLGEDVRDQLQQAFERWDGRGGPAGLRGAEIGLPVRLVQLADIVSAYHRAGGAGAAVAVARERSGTQFDPALVELFCADAEAILAKLDDSATWDAVTAAEPGPGIVLSGERFDSALEAIADFADLKSPYTAGHSRAVADLAAGAARAHGMPEGEVAELRRAGLAHDLGRLGVSNAIWDKPGPLSQPEMERVRLHPYLSERMLASSQALAPLGAIAAQHHERLDGSGYPRGLLGSALSPAARLLAAADAYHAMLEPRPHRPAIKPDVAGAELRAEVRAGRIDGDAADAVLRAAGHRVGRRREGPAGLTPREVEVLRLLARGLSNRQIADELVISRKTAGNHVEHIYAKLEVSNRAAASLFAMRHGLMEEAGGTGGPPGTPGRTDPA